MPADATPIAAPVLIAKSLLIRKNASISSGALTMSVVHAAENPVLYSTIAAIPVDPPGAKSYGSVNTSTHTVRIIPEIKITNGTITKL
jgi:hypothetical protein